MQVWQMQEAKARLSEVVKRAESEGPQDITVHGESFAVVLSRAAYDRLTGNQIFLLKFMRQSLLYGTDDIEFERDRSSTREIAL